jgi:hypothetical protein
MLYTQSEPQDYRKLETFKQIFVDFWLCFRMVAMLLSIFDSRCQVAKPLKNLMIFEGFK